jgi:hypothetical protein
MTYRKFLPVETVLACVPLARAIGVSEAARGRRGFVAAYEAAGSHNALGEDWKAKRSLILERHIDNDCDRWEQDRMMWQGGLPTRLHLLLVMWAYSPTSDRLEAFVKATQAQTQVQ